MPSACAIAGSDVAMTVESMFSMNKAVATISGTMRSAGGECILGGYGLLGQPICRRYANLMRAGIRLLFVVSDCFAARSGSACHLDRGIDRGWKRPNPCAPAALC